jgi:hypothetical protein
MSRQRSLSPAEWQALKVAGRQADAHRPRLAAARYDIDLVLRIRGKLEVKPNTTGARTVTPDVELLIGHLLSLVEPSLREQVLDELPSLYVANDYALPPLELALADRVQKMLERLRRSEQVERFGAVTGLVDVIPERSSA